jgi:hypothetical protein
MNFVRSIVRSQQEQNISRKKMFGVMYSYTADKFNIRKINIHARLLRFA